MAANPGDVQALVSKLRGKGLDDAQVSESLRGMGYTKSDAAAAVGQSSSGGAGGAGGTKRKAAGAGTGRSSAGGPAGGGSGLGSLPSLGANLPKLDMPSPTLRPPRRLNSGDLAGFMTGLLLYTLALNYIRYGPEGVTGWLSAKFLNRVTVSLPAPSPGGGGSDASWGQRTLQPGLVDTSPQVTTA